eukprot:7796811-Pyramimonas_sp.AAC.1
MQHDAVQHVDLVRTRSARSDGQGGAQGGHLKCQVLRERVVCAGGALDGRLQQGTNVQNASQGVWRGSGGDLSVKSRRP